MPGRRWWRVAVLCALFGALAVPARAATEHTGAPILGNLAAQRWLVVLDSSAVTGPVEQIVPPLLEGLGLEVDGVFTHAVDAVLVRGPARLLAGAASLNGVKLIVEDTVVDVVDP